MTALDARPTTPAVAPGVAARRANKVKQGRPLTASELAAIRDLQLEAAYGAEFVGECDSAVQRLLGLPQPSEAEQQNAEFAYEGSTGGYDGETARRQARTWAGAE